MVPVSPAVMAADTRPLSYVDSNRVVHIDGSLQGAGQRMWCQLMSTSAAIATSAATAADTSMLLATPAASMAVMLAFDVTTKDTRLLGWLA